MSRRASGVVPGPVGVGTLRTSAVIEHAEYSTRVSGLSAAILGVYTASYPQRKAVLGDSYQRSDWRRGS